MKRYASYKASGVAWLGDVPKGWDVKRVKHVTNHTTGWTPPTGNSAAYEGQNLWATIADLGDFVIKDTKARISDDAVVNAGIRPSPPGSLLFSFKLSVGQVSIVGEAMYTNEAIATFLPSRDYVVGWAFYAFPIFIPENSAINIYGARLLNQQRINDAFLPVPSLSEQQAIADYLDTETARIDDLIHEKDELIGLLREAQASAFATTVLRFANATVGVNCNRFTWLQSLPSNWRVAKVKHITLSVDQGISPQCESRPPDDGEWGVLKVGCVNTGDFNPMESKALPSDIEPIESITLLKGDVLISRANTKNLVGRAAMADKDYPRLMLSDKHYRLRLDQNECLSQYLVFVLTHGAVRVHIEERATGASASMLNIDRRTIMDLDVPLPPPDVQDEIVREVKRDRAALGRLIAHTHDEITLLKELRAATIADAVLGRIDVRDSAKTIAACD